MVEIRRALQSDFNGLYRLGLSMPALRETRSDKFMGAAEFAFALRNRKGLFLCAVDGAAIVGFSYTEIESPWLACMTYLAVLPRYRGAGLATEMVRRSEAWLVERSIGTVYTLATNEAAAAAFRRWGYSTGKRMVWMYKRTPHCRRAATARARD